MATITTLGGSGSGSPTLTAGAITQTSLFTTPSAGGSPDGANMIFFVRIEVFPEPGVEVGFESTSGQTSDVYPGSQQVNMGIKQHGGVQNRKVGPGTAVYLMTRNRNPADKKIYYTYEWVGIKVA